MKIRLSLLCMLMALLSVNVADAQVVRALRDGGGGGFAEAAFQPVRGDLFGGLGGRGRLWLEANVADQGLGFDGSYLTVGGKTRLFEDSLDGRWVLEGQTHYSLEDDGTFFGNIGVERIFSIDAAGADVAVGFWYDRKNENDFALADDSNQLGLSVALKTERWTLAGNGYFPTGDTDASFGDPTGVVPFAANSVVLQSGISSVLEGFDVTLRVRPERLAFINGSIDFGGYGYSSELIEAFGGGRVRFGCQLPRGLLVNVEVNHDERFDTTGVLSFGWIFGATGSPQGNEFSRLGTDLEQTIRQDAIVTFNQDVVLAVDPVTGLPYNALHVDNTATGFMDGTFENPFATLAQAEAASGPGDSIFVQTGNGFDTGQDQGITLQNQQRLIGLGGGSLLIPVQNGQFLDVGASFTGGAPVISNDTGGAPGSAVVTLANENDVAGFTIDATGAESGVLGSGIDTATIRSNTISNADLDGILLDSITGNVTIDANTLTDNGRNGLHILNSIDPTSEFSITNTTASSNSANGLHLLNIDPSLLLFDNNTTSGNTLNGLLIEDYLSTTTNTLTILNHTASGNSLDGISLVNGSGNVDILNSNITDNLGSGIELNNWTTDDLLAERVLIGITEAGPLPFGFPPAGTSTISGNLFANIRVSLTDPGIQSSVVVTGQTLDGGGRGIDAFVENIPAGVDSILNIDIVDNESISNNLFDGIRLLASDSSIINTTIANSATAGPLAINGNATAGGSGINLITRGSQFNTVPISEINAVVDNVAIDNGIQPDPGNFPPVQIVTTGLTVESDGNAVANVQVTNSSFGTAGTMAIQDGIDLIFTNGNGDPLTNDGSAQEVRTANQVVLDDLTFFSDTAVSLFALDGTVTDFSLTNSNLQPLGAQGGGGPDDTPFTDGIGSFGVQINTTGLPGDMVDDNLTRVNIVDNTIENFTFNGINVNTFGDSRVLLEIANNDVSNNGAGFNDDMDNDNVFNEPGDGVGIADPNNLFFFDGIDINAFGESVISTRITANLLQDNFERGLSLNTFGTATINALLDQNIFIGNDRGEDVDNLDPLLGTGTAAGPNGPLDDSGFFDLEVVNNEEFFIRPFESPILLDAAGMPIDLLGMALPADTPGVFFPINTGMDIFGNIIPIGAASINVDLVDNNLQLDAEFNDFAAAPGDLTFGTAGLNSVFTPITTLPNPLAPLGIPLFEIFPTAVPFGNASSLVDAEETLFDGTGLFN